MSLEIEYASVSACRWEKGRLREAASGAWEVCAKDAVDLTAVPGVMSQPGSSIRITPMDRVLRNLNANAPLAQWKEDHFHNLLQVAKPESSTNADDVAGSYPSLTLQFEGMTREALAVILSPRIAPSARKTYDIVFGAQGNTITTLRKCMPGASKTEPLSVTVPGRVCQEKAWTSYWVCLSLGKLYAGVGSVPGTSCVAILDDLATQDSPPDDDEWIRYVGLGNTAVLDRQHPTPLKVRNVTLSEVPESLKAKLQTLRADALEVVRVGLDEMDEETKAMFTKYEEECRKARARAAKFGVAYKQPPATSFIPWSQARKLRANPTSGFATGIDLLDPAEQAKQEARKARFGIARSEPSSEQTASGEPTSESGMLGFETQPALPLEQAWDNEYLVRSQRSDPPPSLWNDPPPQAEVEKDEFAMQVEMPTIVPEKVHIFSIDWAAFKQIRTNDIMKHFSIYGPTYVEWLGDLSCNVQFEDQFSASRALHNLSQELPSPPPGTINSTTQGDNGGDDEESPDLGKMGWRMSKGLLRKVSNDRYGRRGTTVRLLMRPSTSLDILNERPNSWPKPPPGFTTKRVLGPGSDFPQRKKRDRTAQEATPTAAGPEALLSKGLSAARDGFSVAELEAERAKKKAKAAGSE